MCSFSFMDSELARAGLSVFIKDGHQPYIYIYIYIYIYNHCLSVLLPTGVMKIQNGVVNGYHGMTFDLSGITTKSSGFEALFLELASVSGSSLASDSIVMS